MPENRGVYSKESMSKESMIRRAREKGLTNHQIIVQLSQGRFYKEKEQSLPKNGVNI